MKHLRSLLVSSCVLALALFQASAAIVINEIHYNPDVKTEPAEFIELFNTGPGAVNLGGWFFSDGINYVIPATNLAAGGFVVVAQNPAFLQAKFGVTGALGGGDRRSPAGEWPGWHRAAVSRWSHDRPAA